MRFSFTGGQVGCTMNTSRPRTFSMISTLTLAVAEAADGDAAERQVQVIRDVARERGMSVAGENRGGDRIQGRDSA